VKKCFENRNAGFWLSLAAAASALIVTGVYFAVDLGDKTLSVPGMILALAGVVSTALVIFTRWKLAPLLPAALYSAAFALVLRVALPSLSDVWNKVNFIGGNAAVGMAAAAAYLACALMAVVVCFLGTEKQGA